MAGSYPRRPAIFPERNLLSNLIKNPIRHYYIEYLANPLQKSQINPLNYT